MKGLEQAARDDFDDVLEILLYFNRDFPLERNVSAQTFRLNCTPVANLFRQIAEPIRLTHLQPEYRVIPDVRRQDVTEVYSVEGVTSVAKGSDKVTTYEPFYSYRHGFEKGQAPGVLVHEPPPLGAQGRRRDRRLPLARRPRVQPGQPEADTLTVEVLCTNRDLPSRLPFEGGEADFQLEGAGVFSGIRCLRRPTPTVRAPLRRGLQWRLLSHLSLNLLSLVENGRTGRGRRRSRRSSASTTSPTPPSPGSRSRGSRRSARGASSARSASCSRASCGASR